MSGYKIKLLDVKTETELTKTLIFDRPNDFKFDAGQYVNVVIPTVATHGKAYTISSTPLDETLSLTIKKQGKFSSLLLALDIGAEIEIDGPQGYFFDNFSADKKNVFIAGGIGITPFISLIRESNIKQTFNDLVVLYSNKTKVETTFNAELNDLSKQTKIKLINFLTQEDINGCEIGRIDSEAIKKQINDYSERSFYLCGSISFVNDMWKILGVLGVAEEQIFTEAFF